MKFRFVFFVLVGIFLIFGSIHKIANGATESSILVDLFPPNPAPYENVSISLSSYANNLDTVNISWSVDGKNISAGIGKKNFSLTAKAAGVNTKVMAIIALPEGGITKTININPNFMTLLWQATDSYVPPFYRGKALPTPDSTIKIIAMPEIRTTSGLQNPKNLTYAWKKDYTNEVDGSGYSKNTFTYVNDYLDKTNNVSVTASTLDQQFASEANIDIDTFNPKILFYKNTTALGTIWENALNDSHQIIEKETLVASPYFISPKQLQHPYLKWNWGINGESVDVLNFKKNFLPLQATEGTHGTSKITLEIENSSKIFETAEKELNVEF